MVEVCPVVILDGLKETVQELEPSTVTFAEHWFTEPDPLSTVSEQVCVPVGVTEAEPLAPVSVPLPRFPLQL